MHHCRSIPARAKPLQLPDADHRNQVRRDHGKPTVLPKWVELGQCRFCE
jgi:hypothetical protein